MFYRLYSRMPGQKRFKAMDYNAGTQVGNLIYATFFTEAEAAKLEDELDALEEINPGWKFEIRPVE